MKTLKKLIPVVVIAVLLTIICWPGKSYAEGGGYVSDSEIEVALGDTAYITVGVDNAAGTYSVSSSGNVMANDSGWLDNDIATIGIYGASE